MNATDNSRKHNYHTTKKKQKRFVLHTARHLFFCMSEHVKVPVTKTFNLLWGLEKKMDIVTHECFLFHKWGQMMDLDYWIKSETIVSLKLAPSASD